MDDRDRTIISFGEDENKEPEVETKIEVEGSGFTMTPSEPKEEVKAEEPTFIMKEMKAEEPTFTFENAETEILSEEPTTKVEGSGFTMTPSEPKEDAKPNAEASDFTMKVDEAPKAETPAFNMKAETTGPSIPEIKPEFKSQGVEAKEKAADVHFGAAARNIEEAERVTETQKAAERKKSADVHFGAAARNIEEAERVTETQKSAERKKSADVHFGAAARNIEEAERAAGSQKTAAKDRSVDVHFGAAARNIEEAERAAGSQQSATARPAQAGTYASSMRESSMHRVSDVEARTAAQNAASQPRVASDAERRTASQQVPASAHSAPRAWQSTAASIPRAGQQAAASAQAQNVGRMAATQAPQSEPYVPAHQPRAHAAPVPKKKKKEKKYVTRGGLFACMLITMLLSAMLGLGIGRFLAGSNSGSGIADRNDSGLSHLSLSDATGSELSVKEIIDMNADAVVEIVVSGTTQGLWGQLQLTEGAGSGVIVKENGYIATNYHVIQGANKIEVTLRNGETYNATIVGSDAENDVAVIKIDAKDLKTATIGDSSTVNVGDLAVAIGNPLGQLGGTATTGIISALDRTLSVEGTTLTLLQTDAAINGGNSGGGLFNSRGELIGIVESKASAVGVEGLAFALPINSVSEIINDMIENGGNATRVYPAVGIVILDVSDENLESYGLDSAGLYIAQVTGENAKKAGFKEKDKIISIDGTKVKTSSEFISLVRKHKVGDSVTIVVSRGGQEIEIKTVLEQLQSE